MHIAHYSQRRGPYRRNVFWNRNPLKTSEPTGDLYTKIFETGSGTVSTCKSDNFSDPKKCSNTAKINIVVKLVTTTSLCSELVKFKIIKTTTSKHWSLEYDNNIKKLHIYYAINVRRYSMF